MRAIAALGNVPSLAFLAVRYISAYLAFFSDALNPSRYFSGVPLRFLGTGANLRLAPALTIECLTSHFLEAGIRADKPPESGKFMGGIAARRRGSLMILRPPGGRGIGSLLLKSSGAWYPIDSR